MTTTTTTTDTKREMPCGHWETNPEGDDWCGHCEHLDALEDAADLARDVARVMETEGYDR